ncbi:MAG: efflux RND transporter periplasmic adaptor subunit [Fimbriiglobus sp.]|nr:efflux RND transporter periplasmic adaptor subunit [Fimbriiglobus sp.]
MARVLGVLKSVVIVAVSLAGLGLFLAWMGGAFHHKVHPGSEPVEKATAAGRMLVAAERTTEAETITSVGSVQPRRRTDVASQLLASIREIKPRPGDVVKKGEVIATLDDRDLLAQQREASAALTAAQAELATRSRDYDRVKNLSAASADEKSKAEGAFRVAEAQVIRAREAVGRVEVMLTYTKIVAGTDGVVADRFADPGDIAAPGKPLLTVYDPSDLELHANVPESLAAGIKLGQRLTVRIDANNLSAEAQVREIVPQAQTASRSVVVKLALPEQTARPILPGMFGRLVIPVGVAERVWVPKAAIQARGQLDLVEVEDGHGHLARRFVRLGREADGKVEILSGLSGGEKLALPAN